MTIINIRIKLSSFKNISIFESFNFLLKANMNYQWLLYQFDVNTCHKKSFILNEIFTVTIFIHMYCAICAYL